MMNTGLPTTELTQQLGRLQDITQQFEQPWKLVMENYGKIMQKMNFVTYNRIIETYSSLADLYRIPDYLDGTGFLRPDTEDGAEDVTMRPLGASTQEDKQREKTEYSTGAVDVNKANQEYLDYLRTRTDEIANAIMHTEFEDGMDNDITLLIKSFARSNKSATYNWLGELYSKNVTKPSVLQGILRTLAMITEKGDENILLPMVLASLRSDNSAEQEAAIMVIEEWRTKECLDAISNVPRFSSDIIADYAKMVTDELKQELGEC